MPASALSRGWPVRLDHCFQRILLDAVFGGRWTDHVEDRPAYKSISRSDLDRAIALGEEVMRGRADLRVLNRQSLAWRSKQKLISINSVDLFDGEAT